MARQPDINARKALDEMKLEAASELNINLTNVLNSRKTTNQRAENTVHSQFTGDDGPDTFNPS